MNLLVTGRGTSGSWQIRGEQLGRAIGATVLPKAIDVAAFDLAVLVKRAEPDLVQRLHRAGVPIVWDVVDAWPQPSGNSVGKAECMAWLSHQVQTIRPAAIVAATVAMANDCAAFGVPVLALPHHARPGLKRAEIRPLQVVGYEGGEAYLDGWRRSIDRACDRRGLKFVVNPPDLGAVDIVLALRDATGYAPRNWKSNVKLANAQALGLPVICTREAGYLETASGAERWADTPEELEAAISDLAPIKTRQQVSEVMFKAAPSLERVATIYAKWLRECTTASRS